MDKFTYNMFYEIEKPTVILSSVSHKHYGVLENVDMNSFECNFNMNSAQEISFDVYKYFDEHLCSLWNKLISFKYIYIPQHHEYYKIDVSLDQDNKTVKHVTGTSAGEWELGQRKIRSLEINTESDITKTEKLDEITGKYVEVENTVENSGYTILYNPDNPEKSLLDRALHDRAPDWSIAHVDKTIASKQRTFSVSEQTIYDFFTNTVANELNCLFKFDSVNRTISVYDLLNTCTNSECNYRGEFTNKCPKCGNTEYIRGYGHDSHIHISAANYANKITVDGDEGSVKNCFKVTGGDDLMTATIKNSNPSGSEFIYKFSDADLDDMPEGLRNALTEYYEKYDEKNAEYQEYVKNYYNALNTYYYYKTSMMPRSDVKHWQSGTERREGYQLGDKVYVITLPSWCYLECVQAGVSGNEEFDATYLDDSGDDTNPTIIQDGTVKWKVVKHKVDIPTASQAMNDVVAFLADANNKVYFEPSTLDDPLNKADTTISRYVRDLLEAFINPLFKLEILSDGLTWSHTSGSNTGTLNFYLKITNTTNTNDTVTSKDKNADGQFIWNNGNSLTAHCQVARSAQELENFLLQLTKKRLDRKDTTFNNLWELDDDEEFKLLLEQYSLDLLEGFAKSYADCKNVLLANNIGDPIASNFHGVNLYAETYIPYNTRLGYIEAEAKKREETVKYWYNDPNQKDDSTSDIPVGNQVAYDEFKPIGQVQFYYNKMKEIQKELDLKTALGDYWSIFFNYLREGEYSNSNYISDGLSDNILVDDAGEVLEKARLELEKASELQYTLSDDLNNLLSTEEFAPFKDSFKLGDFIMCSVGAVGASDDLDMDNHLYKLRLIQVSYQYGSPTSLSVTFSNVTKIKNYFSDTQDILAQAKSMGTSYNVVTQQVERNKQTTQQVSTWNENGLNSSLVKILNNNKEEVTYDNNGITLREYDYGYDENKKNAQGYSDKQLRITHDLMTFTTDNWKTASLALGENTFWYYDESSKKIATDVGYGLIAKFVDGGYIHGSQIVAGTIYSENYTPTTGTYFDLKDGNVTIGGGKLKYDTTNGLEVDGKIHAKSGSFTGNITSTATISGGTISGGTITGSTISGNTISGGTISGTTISGNTISGGTISGTTISGSTISGNTISGGTMSGSSISGGTISGATITSSGNQNVKIEGGVITTSRIYLYPTTYSGGSIIASIIAYTNQQLTNPLGGLYFDSDGITLGKNTYIGDNGGNNLYAKTVVADKYRIDDATTSTQAPNCRILTDGTYKDYLAYATGSSIRYKHDFKTIFNEELDPHNLYNIKIYQYKYQTNYLDNEEDNRYDTDVIGFIAENVEKYYPIAVDKNYNKETGKSVVTDWNDKYIIPPMLKLIQEQHEEIEILKQEIQQLKNGGN